MPPSGSRDDNGQNTPASRPTPLQVGTTDADGKVALTGSARHATRTPTPAAPRAAGPRTSRRPVHDQLPPRPAGCGRHLRHARPRCVRLDERRHRVRRDRQRPAGQRHGRQPSEYRWTVDPTAADSQTRPPRGPRGPGHERFGQVGRPVHLEPSVTTPRRSPELPAGSTRSGPPPRRASRSRPESLRGPEVGITFTGSASANAPLNGDYTVKEPTWPGRRWRLARRPDGNASPRPVPATQRSHRRLPTSPARRSPVASPPPRRNGSFSVVVRPRRPPNVPGTPRPPRSRRSRRLWSATSVATTRCRRTTQPTPRNRSRSTSRSRRPSADRHPPRCSRRPAPGHRRRTGRARRPGHHRLGTDNDATRQRPQARDVPVEVSVDKGYLSPNRTPTPGRDHGDAADLWFLLQERRHRRDFRRQRRVAPQVLARDREGREASTTTVWSRFTVKDRLGGSARQGRSPDSSAPTRPTRRSGEPRAGHRRRHRGRRGWTSDSCTTVRQPGRRRAGADL